MRLLPFTLTFTILLFGLSVQNSSAQNIRLKNSSSFIEKVANSTYRKTANGYLYKFDSNGTISYTDNNNTHFVAIARKSGSNIQFNDFGENGYNGEYQGYFDANSNRFMDSKDNVVATITNSNEVIDGAGNVLFKIDSSMPKEVVGFFVFYRY